MQEEIKFFSINALCFEHAVWRDVFHCDLLTMENTDALIDALSEPQSQAADAVCPHG